MQSSRAGSHGQGWLCPPSNSSSLSPLFSADRATSSKALGAPAYSWASRGAEFKYYVMKPLNHS